jgi:hypothetical protein
MKYASETAVVTRAEYTEDDEASLTEYTEDKQDPLEFQSQVLMKKIHGS